MNRLTLAFLLLPALAGSAQAAQSPASAAAKGRVAPLVIQVTDPSLPAAQSKALATRMDGLVDRALATPAFVRPTGFSLTRSVKIDEALPGQPARATATMIAQSINLEAGAKPDASGAYMGRLEGPTLRLIANDLLSLYPNTSWSDTAATEMRYMPQQVGERDGFPIYRVGIRKVIVVAKPGRQPFVRMTKAERLQGLMAEFTGPERAELAQDLAALSPRERAEPACVSARLSQQFGDCAKGAEAYVRINTAYFDKGLPRGAVQLVMISSPEEGGYGHRVLEPKMRAAAAAIDLKAIQANLD